MRRILSVMAGLAALSCGHAALADPAACARIPGVLPASVFALPTGGGVLQTEWIPAVGDARAYCRVLGRIAPVDPAAPPILFQVNLPDGWNGKAVQYGGGGMNGTLISGLAPLRDAPPGPTPLNQGYATFGTDAGHPDAKPEIQVFALNDEALINHGYAAYKKTYDAAVSVIAAAAGRRPTRIYFFGGSEGGRQALMAIQRYPRDYDGAVSVVPVLNYTAMTLAKYALWIGQVDGGWIGPDQMAAVEKATLEACDGLDGLKDGVISQYLGCGRAMDIRTLACGSGPGAPTASLRPNSPSSGP